MKKYIIKVCYYSDTDVIIFPHDYPFGDNIVKKTKSKKIIVLSGSERIKKKLRRRKLDELLKVHHIYELPSVANNHIILVMREFVV